MSICYLLDGETPPARKNGKSLPCVLLQTENAELRKERDALDHLTDVLNATNDGLISENAKLRELVRDFYPFVVGRAAKPWLEVRRDRMRELGVEV